MKILILFCFALLFISTPAVSASLKNGSVVFHAEAKPSILKFDGTGATFEGTPALAAGKLSGSFKVGLKPIDTGLETRNRHMCGVKYLNCEAYPYATFLLDPVDMSPGTRKFTGKLKIRDREQPVTGEVVFSGAKFVARFQIDVTQYGIPVPEYERLTVGKDVSITAQGELQ